MSGSEQTLSFLRWGAAESVNGKVLIVGKSSGMLSSRENLNILDTNQQRSAPEHIIKNIHDALSMFSKSRVKSVREFTQPESSRGKSSNRCKNSSERTLRVRTQSIMFLKDLLSQSRIDSDSSVAEPGLCGAFL